MSCAVSAGIDPTGEVGVWGSRWYFWVAVLVDFKMIFTESGILFWFDVEPPFLEDIEYWTSDRKETCNAPTNNSSNDSTYEIRTKRIFLMILDNFEPDFIVDVGRATQFASINW